MGPIEDAIRKAKTAALAKQEHELRTLNAGVKRLVPGGSLPARKVATSRQQLRLAGLLPPKEEEHRLATEYRAIKRGLLVDTASSTGAARGKVIMVASALPGEGKTFTTLNLAMSLATERDWSVVLIDADVAKPHLSELFGLQNERGLLDAVADPRVSLRDVTWGTQFPGLSMIGAGHASEAATELLASARMRALITETRQLEPRTILLFDSPPVLVTSESRALADCVGQIVLVVRADETPRKAGGIL